MTSPKPAAAVDLDALKCAVDRSACTDANQWAYSDFTADFSPDVLRALIAELEQLRAGAPRWIAVSERMPDDEQPVWLHQDGWSVVPGYREFDVWRHRDDWRISQPSGGMQPTHWAARYERPAPSPPEAVKP